MEARHEMVIHVYTVIIPYQWAKLILFLLGQAITASLPVYIRNVMVGVVAVDLTMEELFTDATHFEANEFSYAFVIERSGKSRTTI